MLPFPEVLIAQLTKTLTTLLVNASGRRLRRAFEDPERTRALERCSEAGIVAMIRASRTGDPAELVHLHEVIRSFFTSEEIEADLGRAVAPLLRGHNLNLAEMEELFEEAGYDPETLPGFDVETAFAAFAGAFAAAAVEQPALHGEMQTHLLFSQLSLQREMRDSLRQLARFLAQARPGTAAVSAEQITAENVAGTQIFFSSPILHLPASSSADWEPHYLRTLVHRCDPLDLSPIDETHPQGSRPDAGTVRLSDVFTSLFLEGVARSPSQDVAQAIAGPRSRDERPGPVSEKGELQPITALEAAEALPRLVVLGRPGGGKSTLVNHLVTQLAKRRLGQAAEPDKLPAWPPSLRPLPVRVILRHFASWLPDEAGAADAGLVWDYLKHQLERSGCLDAFKGLHDTLTGEGGMVFFDGLDEVHEDDARRKRSQIRDSIHEFASPLEKCRVMVTCREYAYGRDDAWRLPAADFPAVLLAPFDLEQVKSFTSTWYRVIGPPKGWNEARCEREASHLAQAVENWPHLRALAESPLLLTLMAQIHGRDGYLPRDRADLYERTVNLLLAHWENRLVRELRAGSTVEPDRVLRLDVRTDVLRSALEKVAFEAHERQERQSSRSASAADVPADDLLHALEEHLGSFDRARDVITYLQERAGLLQAIDGTTYRFPHRTFQEYLAAKYLLKQPEYDEMLRDRVRRDLAWWREPFLLAAGASRETPRMISDLVDQLIPRRPGDVTVSAEQAERARLAAQALEETGFVVRVDKEKATEEGRFTATCGRVRDWLLRAMRATKSLEPVERARCGGSLAVLGDPRAEVLTPDEMRLCLVPAGPFRMGSEEQKRERPPHLNEHLDYDYWMARYPVTTAQFRQYVEASGNEPEDADALRGQANAPVVWVSWHEARGFCRWLTGEWRQRGLLSTDWEVRLPSEAEWEKAARGGLEVPVDPLIRRIEKALQPAAVGEISQTSNPDPQRAYPWVGEYDKNRCNSADSAVGSSSAVGCFSNGNSPYGCEEMSGNAWEWTRSRVESYPYDPSDGREDESADPDAARWVLRGGGYWFGADLARCAARDDYGPARRTVGVGFRVVCSPSGL